MPIICKAMTRTSLDHHNCSFARTVDIIGDRWSLMILRDAFYGVRRFSEFKRRLGVTQGILSSRLAQMVERGLLDKHLLDDTSSREEYRLTASGRAMFPIVVAIMQWGDDHIHSTDGPPIRLFDKGSQQVLDALTVCVGGEPLALQNVGFEPGPNASSATISEFEKMARKAL